MTRATFFVQECPTCGRRLQVKVMYLGKKVVCQHCSGSFEARDPANAMADPAASGVALLQRAEQLLASVGETRPRPR